MLIHTMLNGFKVAFNLMLISAPFWVQGQSVRLIKSTDQSWSGGIAGRTGHNYTFSIKFSKVKHPLVLDTLWIGQYPIPIIIKDEWNNQVNTHFKKDRRSITYEIAVGTSEDENPNHNPIPQKNTENHSPIQYHGVALLSYIYNGKRKVLNIKKIHTTYPPVSYP